MMKLKQWITTCLALVLLIFITFSSLGRISSRLQKKETISSFKTRSPPLQQKTNWIIISGYPQAMSELCAQASEKFPNWDVAVVTMDRKSIHVCRTGVTRLVDDLSYGYPSSELSKTPLLAAGLLAIQEGAEAIYLPSRTWMSSSNSSVGVKIGKSYTGLVSQKKVNTFTSPGCQLDFFATHRHFGCIQAEHVKDAKPLYDLCERELPGIQAPILIPRSRQIQGDSPVCDPRAPPVAIPEDVYIDNLQIEAALYTKRAFWALIFPALIEESFIPKNILPRVRILIQKVLWSTGTNVMLWHNGYNLTVTKSVNIGYLSQKDKVLLNKLKNLNCPMFNVRSCLKESMSILNGHPKSQNLIYAVNGWLDTLELINVKPQRDVKDIRIIRRHVMFYPVDYSKRLSGKTQSKVPYVPITNIKHITEQYKKTCDVYKVPKDINVNLTHPYEQFSEILLVVIFNKGHYEVIPLIETLYRPFFPNIIYCGPGSHNVTHEALLKKYRYSFLNYQMTHRIHVLTGLCNYECAAMALSMSYNVEGYAIMGDDVVISLPKIYKLPRDSAWYIHKAEYGYVNMENQATCANNSCTLGISWFWWGFYRYASEMTIQTMRYGQTNEAYRRCYNRLISITGSTNPVFTGLSDFYYVPKRLASDFVELAWLFRKNGVFLEITAPTIMNCIEDPDRLEQMPSSYLLSAEREKPWLFFDEEFQRKVILHPTKWGPIFKGSVGHVLFYCTQVIPYLHDPLARVR